jgi:Mn2+/Fe2+ NRAMP family transporter
MILSTLGATITPWMLFFQQSATADKGLTRSDIKFGRLDTLLGAVLAALAALGMVVVTAPLFSRHMSPQHFQAAEFAQALQPIIGRFGSALFSLGMVEAGMVAAITISASSAYAFGEVARTPHSLNLGLREGKAFYSILFLCVALAAATALIPGLPLVYVVMSVNVFAVLAMPPALIFLFLLANDKEIVGDLVSPLWANIVTGIIVVLLTTAGILFGLNVIAPKVLVALAGNS